MPPPPPPPPHPPTHTNHAKNFPHALRVPPSNSLHGSLTADSSGTHLNEAVQACLVGTRQHVQRGVARGGAQRGGVRHGGGAPALLQPCIDVLPLCDGLALHVSETLDERAVRDGRMAALLTRQTAAVASSAVRAGVRAAAAAANGGARPTAKRRAKSPSFRGHAAPLTLRLLWSSPSLCPKRLRTRCLCYRGYSLVLPVERSQGRTGAPAAQHGLLEAPFSCLPETGLDSDNSA